MTMKCGGCGADVEIGEAVILAAAGRIYASRRKRCGPRPKPVACSWSGRECAGRAGLMAHLPVCAEAIAYYAGLDLGEVADFFAEAGVPPDAA